MRIECLQHSALGGNNHLQDWARCRGHGWSALILPQVRRLPAPDDFDLLVIMGGPMSAWEDRRHPWLLGEKRLIEATMAAGKPVLGICLGAQLLALVLGARVYRFGRQEIGWHPVMRVREARMDPVCRVMPDVIETFLWHGDTFELPAGAVPIARSPIFENQGFRCDGALALQFHLEVTPDWVRRIAERDAQQLRHPDVEQDFAAIVGRPQSLFLRNNALLDRLLDRWLEHLRAGV